MERLFLMLQMLQVIYLWLRAGLSRRLGVTLVQILPYTLVLGFCVRYFGELYPRWLDAWIWFSYGLLLAVELRAWWLPENVRSFWLKRNGRLHTTLHLLVQGLTAATLLVFFALQRLPPGTPSLPHAMASITIHAPMERVWHLLADIDHWPQWNEDIRTATLDGPLVTGTASTGTAESSSHRSCRAWSRCGA